MTDTEGTPTMSTEQRWPNRIYEVRFHPGPGMQEVASKTVRASHWEADDHGMIRFLSHLDDAMGVVYAVQASLVVAIEMRTENETVIDRLRTVLAGMESCESVWAQHIREIIAEWENPPAAPRKPEPAASCAVSFWDNQRQQTYVCLLPAPHEGAHTHHDVQWFNGKLL